MQPVLERHKVFLLTETQGRVSRKPRGHNRRRSGPEEAQRNVVPNLDTPARNERHSICQVGHLVSLRPVEGCAGGAEGKVKVVQIPEALFARVALARAVNSVAWR